MSEDIVSIIPGLQGVSDSSQITAFNKLAFEQKSSFTEQPSEQTGVKFTKCGFPSAFGENPEQDSLKIHEFRQRLTSLKARLANQVRPAAAEGQIMERIQKMRTELTMHQNFEGSRGLSRGPRRRGEYDSQADEPKTGSDHR